MMPESYHHAERHFSPKPASLVDRARAPLTPRTRRSGRNTPLVALARERTL